MTARIESKHRAINSLRLPSRERNCVSADLEEARFYGGSQGVGLGGSFVEIEVEDI
jgi:hypothetical protein